MSWIKMRVNLDTDPAVIEIASRLKLHELDIVGRLWKIWAWADQHSADGNAVCVTSVTLDRFTGVTGFASALRKVGWLTGKDNCLTFPNFDRHNGHSAKLRGKTQKRVAEFRNAKSVTSVTGPALPDKRRVDKIDTPTEYPEVLRSEAFAAVWKEWAAHRKEIKKPLTPTSAKQQLQRLAELGEAKAIEIIRHTIFKGWQGLKESDNGTNQKSNRSGAPSDRNAGTANEGRGSMYAGLGKV